MTRSNRAIMDDNALINAGVIIERFGGIRPMAKKIDVAVTTIQGWKKRDVIPATRRDLVLQAAATHNVDLTDIVSDAPSTSRAANENATAIRSVTPDAAQPVKFEKYLSSETAVAGSIPRTGSAPTGDLDKKLAETEKRAVKKSTWINVVLIVLALASAAVLLWPNSQDSEMESQRIGTLENNVGELRTDVEAVKAEQSFLSTLIPKDLDDRITKLQQQARDTQEKVSAALNVASQVSTDVLGENAGTVGQRMEKLGGHVAAAAATPEMAALMSRFQGMTNSVAGESQLNQAVAELSALVSSFESQTPAVQGPVMPGQAAPASADPFASALDAARAQSTALSQTFDGVPAKDMKAAALLLSMTQFRQSLNRDNAPFQDDLQLLVNLVGEDDPELVASLQRLAPQAEAGVLTPSGLTNEFKTMAGEAVVASLKGEDVSIQDRAKARMNELFAVEKDGELISGTPEQATMAKAEDLLNEGDLAGAIAHVETLEGPAADVAAPWLEKARATLNAQGVQGILNESMDAVAAGTSTLIQNKELGINILKQNDPLAAQKMKELYQ